jgi:hypothetical protein
MVIRIKSVSYARVLPLNRTLWGLEESLSSNVRKLLNEQTGLEQYTNGILTAY